MLNHLDKIVLKKNILENSDYYINYNSDQKVYKSIFNEYKKYLLNKEIEFDNISTKQKRKDNEDIISANFIVNNFLNILNIKDVKKNFYMKKNTHINKQKKN